MTQFLPPNLLALFAAREPVPYLPPVDKPPHERKQRGYLGVGAFLGQFELPADTPPPTRVETREERLERRRRERQEQVAYELEREIAVWDPAARPDATSDAFKTLFVARINYDSSESKLRREFEGYGAIKKIALVHDSVNGKPRGYAFIEYEHERDMHSAYKHADGKKIDGRRVLVDVERARTVKGWLPRRLGGGLGGTRRGGPDVNIKHSGREDNERERERYRLEHERDRDRERRPVDPERRRERSRESAPGNADRDAGRPGSPRRGAVGGPGSGSANAPTGPTARRTAAPDARNAGTGATTPPSKRSASKSKRSPSTTIPTMRLSTPLSTRPPTSSTRTRRTRRSSNRTTTRTDTTTTIKKTGSTKAKTINRFVSAECKYYHLRVNVH
ncbi:small ribonucleoprotein particle U1 subunit 70K isoform X1 [Arctopsyche grandis]|uniref:small ribonucleoprotein particle U1 subunit 70K isoform X1 n=1 Tax=Arctopsyche grandis TaxID=121162 RepID=UPI00406D6821